MDNVKDAIVKLAIPEQKSSIFLSQQQVPTASVHITTTNGDIPDDNLVNAVKKATATAIVGLTPDNVTVTCQNGLVLGDLDEVFGGLYTNHQAFKSRMELEFVKAVSTLLSPVLGADNYTAAANVNLNWDDSTVESFTLIPTVDDELGVVESMETISEISRGNGVAVGEPGIDENGGGDTYEEVEGTAAAYYEKNTNIVNYQISRITEITTKAKGNLEGLTFSIVLNNAVFPDSTELTSNIRSVVGGAIGLESSDYSLISVMYSPFIGVQNDIASREAYEKQLRTDKILSWIKNIVLILLIGICLILLIMKTFQLLRKPPEEEELLEGMIEEEQMSDVQALVEMATLGEIAETRKSPFREQVEKFIDKNPDAVAELLRNWIND
jgi:flagellar M-ring protein FliF